jgi:murein DD-endopeptidase MepM/ murein hydrolase activator NlpD
MVTVMHDRPAQHRNAMRWLWPILVAILLMPGVAAAPPAAGPVYADDLSDAVQKQMALDKLISDQKKQLAAIAGQEAALQKQMALTQKNLDGVSQSMDQLQGDIDTLQSQVDTVQSSYDALLAREADLQKQVEDLDAQARAKADELAGRQKLLAQRLVDAYKTDKTPLLAQILTGGSLTNVLSDVSYYLDLGAQDKALADQIKKDQTDLATMKTNVELAQMSVGQIAAQVAGQKDQLDTQMAQLNMARAKLLALQKKINAEMAKQQAADARLARNKALLAAAIKSNGAASAKLAKLIDSLVAKYGGKGRIPSAYNGKLQWPMGGSISQEFGCTGVPMEPRYGSCAHFHNGIDLVAPCLTPVRAAGSGVVLFVGYNPYDAPPRAWIVIIAHSSTLITWYAHMTGKAPAGIRAGAQVYVGQLIGTENTTGHSTGCHLHWAVRVSGVFMNPRLFV